MTHPKYLQVIKEEKQKRFEILQRCYTIAAFVVPSVFVPWPFIEIGYGKDEYPCWLFSKQHCNASTISASNVVVQLLMWHFWAVLVWICAVVMLLIAIYHYCTHKSAPNITKSNHSLNACAITSLLLTFIVVITSFHMGIDYRKVLLSSHSSGSCPYTSYADRLCLNFNYLPSENEHGNILRY